MTTQQVIDKIFKDPTVKYELSEFEGFGIPIHEMINIYSKNGTGKQTGKKIYYIKPLASMYSEKEEIQVYVEGGKSAAEEIVRQLWVYKLINFYHYKPEQIVCEIPVQFGVEINTKYADIAVYRDESKETVKLLFEIKKPKRKDGIEQLKSYLGAKGNPIGIWSNGTDRLILYKPQSKDFDTLSEIPKVNEEEKDVLEIKRTLTQLKTSFNFKKIIQDLEELVLANSGADEFNEIFKLIFAKIWDEKEASSNRRERPNKEVLFKKFEDPILTYDTINGLFRNACNEWKGIFKENEDIELKKDHLQVCIGPIEPVRLMGSNLRIMDDAFEYLLPTEAKKKKGQFFTPRHVIEMCVRMMNPQYDEYVMDPSCGSAGFLLHAMEWAYPAASTNELESRKHKYAGKYLWGIDIEARAAKTSRALMLIAGDGHTNIFGPDVSSLDPRDWYTNKSGKYLMSELSKTPLLKAKIPNNETFEDNDKAWEYFGEMNFDVILANPPFAGEMKDKKMLSQYDLAKPALKRAKDKTPKEERDVLFIERIVKMLRPGGRAAIVLPQGKFNNSSLAFIREWILRKARLLGVVGLHGNSFKPHTGTKTSVLFIQKYTDEELADIIKVQKEIENQCPDYAKQIQDILAQFEAEIDIPEENISEEIFELLLEEYSEPEIEEEETTESESDEEEEESNEPLTLDDKLEIIEEKISGLRNGLLKAKDKLAGLADDVEGMKLTHKAELKIALENWEGTKKDFNLHIKPVKEQHKVAIKTLKDSQKEKAKQLKAEIKSYDKQIPLAEEEKLLLTNKGKLQLLLDNEDSIEKIRNRYIDAEVAKQLDYPIFMAVSERGGKNNSGDYEYMLDDDGNLMEDTFGNPEIDQDLVNHSITREDLLTPDFDFEKADLNIAEAFVKFSKEQGFDFWKN
ncbi:restriction endonuclease subunit M [Cellulophaga baltica]|uniref:restriction endonuclease subunit M n=1 Tax=Cellulophaga baltica TaxID=76594 RepID=UPI0015F4F010|nr:N-6 DNA methylase [Cellulophaga baltica]MBA6316254.1 N-6 DNA methylase [Cellulophaga baltica]